MNQQLMTMAVGLGMSQVARRLDLDTPERLFGIRALYLVTNIIIFCMYLYIAAKVSPTRPRAPALAVHLLTVAFWVRIDLTRSAERTIIPS